jgi:hypothetical protein
VTIDEFELLAGITSRESPRSAATPREVPGHRRVHAQKALAALQAKGDDTTGSGFKPITVTRNAGGA